MIDKNIDTKPWYKQFWPWFVIAFPITAVIAGTATVIIAMHEPDGLVADDYYKEGLAINRTLAKEQMAKQLNLSAELSLKNNQVILYLKGNLPLPEKLYTFYSSNQSKSR